MKTEQLDQIAADFSKTIFWNNLNPWPADNEEPYPLKVIAPAPPAYPPGILLRFESGELSVDVAQLPEQGDDADVGNISSEADAAFIAQLPVIMPDLLAAAKRDAKVRELLENRIRVVGADCDEGAWILKLYSQPDGYSVNDMQKKIDAIQSLYAPEKSAEASPAQVAAAGIWNATIGKSINAKVDPKGNVSTENPKGNPS